MTFPGGSSPVSYTHLDVYKRQQYKFVNKLNDTYKGVDIDVDDEGSYYLNAVSYTHLDVYKRQVE